MFTYFNIRKEEYNSTLYGFAYSFLIIALFILSKSLRDSLFLNSFTKQDLSYIYLASPIITGILIWVLLLFFKNISLSKKSIIIHLLLFFSSTFLLLNLNQTNILCYYIFVDFQIAIIAIMFWDALSESFTNRQAKRLFVVITSGGFLSALIIGSSLSYISQFINQEIMVVMFNLLVLFCPFLTYKLVSNTFKTKSKDKRQKSSVGFKYIFNNKYILNIVFITFLFTIISIIIDYNFKILSFNQFQNDSVELTNFFAKFYSISAFISFLIQITISGYIINRFGIKYALMVLPILLLFVFVLGYFISSFLVIVLLKGKEQIFKSTLHDTSMHILWMPIPSFKRLTIKPLVNILLKNIFSSIAAGLLILSVYLNLEFLHFIPITCILLLFLLILTRRTKDFYVKELIKAIDDRSLSLDDESSAYISDDNEMLKIINQKLTSEIDNRYFILHLLDDSIINKCKDTLGEIFKDSDAKTQSLILKYLANDNNLIESEYLVNEVENSSNIAIECLNTLCLRNFIGVEKLNDNLFDSTFLDLKYAAINNSISYNFKSKINAVDLLKNDIKIKNNIPFILNYISNSSYRFSKDEIITLFNDLDYDDFIVGLKFINKENINHEILEIITNKLSLGYYYKDEIYQLLERINCDALYNFFEFKLIDSSTRESHRKFICDAIKFINDINYLPIYYKYFELSKIDNQIVEQIIDSLMIFKKENKKYFNNKDFSNSILEKVIYNQYYDIILIDLINKDKNKLLIKEFYLNKFKDNNRLLMKIINFINNDIFSKDLQSSMFYKTIHHSKVIEIFEEYLDDKLRNKVIPLLDSIPEHEKVNYGIKYYNELSDLSIESLYNKDIVNQDHWYAFVILAETIDSKQKLFSYDEIINNRYFKLLINTLNFDDEEIFKSNNQQINKIMITNLEKTLYLKDSNIFKDIPAKELIHIANCLKEVDFTNSNIIFKDNDIGDSMYFIVKGEVKILKGDIELVVLGKGDYFGEMALLDGESRSADAIAKGDCILLQLNAVDFEKIMYSNDKIVKGILGMLSQRLRNANELLNQKK